MSRALAVLAILLAAAPVAAQGAITTALAPLPPMEPIELGGGRPLTLEEVVASVAAHHPVIEAADARVLAAEGAQLAADGGFDPALTVQGAVAPAGYYRYARADALVTQATPLWGTTFFGGWRIGRGIDGGTIPPYYGQWDTLEGGELRAGVTIPLWRDGPIDSRRAAITRAGFARTAAADDRDARALRTELASAESYFRWVAAGLKLGIALDLLRIAEERDHQIASRVVAGAIPAIEHLDNRRAILERRQAVVAARRAVERAAIALSLYLRDDDGTPRVVGLAAVPSSVPAQAPLRGSEDDLVARALELRPELARVRAQREAARVLLELADNQIAPRIDLSALGAVDLGSAGDSPRDQQLAPPVFEAGLLFSLPLGMREARGRADAARAELAVIEADAELAGDQIGIEVRDAMSALRAAEQAVELAAASVEAAEAVARGERTRFENGAVSLLMVNLREAAAAAAQSALVDAQADLGLAGAWLQIAVGRSLGSE